MVLVPKYNICMDTAYRTHGLRRLFSWCKMPRGYGTFAETRFLCFSILYLHAIQSRWVINGASCQVPIVLNYNTMYSNSMEFLRSDPLQKCRPNSGEQRLPFNQVRVISMRSLLDIIDPVWTRFTIFGRCSINSDCLIYWPILLFCTRKIVSAKEISRKTKTIIFECVPSTIELHS